MSDWLRSPLDEINRGMVVARHGELADIPSGANHLFRAFRSIWNHARRTSNLLEPPTFATEWYEEQPDRRVIEDLADWRPTVDGLETHHQILEPLRRLDPEWVFPARKSEAGHLVSPMRIPWSPHAHRRPFATVAMEARVIEEVVGRLLNRTPLSITGHRYVRPSPDSLRPAMDTICTKLCDRVSSK